MAVLAGQNALAKWLMAQASGKVRTALYADLRDLWNQDGHTPSLRLALELGWKPADQKEGEGALQLAVRSNDLRSTQALVKAGVRLRPVKQASADPFLPNIGTPNNVLHLAAAHADTTLLEYLLHEIASSTADWRPSLKEALHSAARSGNVAAVEVLVDKHNVDVNARVKDDDSSWLPQSNSYEGETPLMAALGVRDDAEQSQMIELLLKKGAQLDGKDSSGRHLLVRAAAGSPVSVVQTLIDHGADLEATDNEGRTALHLAAQHGHHEVIGALMAIGANVHATDKNGKTPAILAMERGHEFP